jgi:hypothetical protein
MSVVSDVQDALDTIIEANLPGYVRLSDSYDAPDNPNLYLKKGYATAYGPGQNNSSNFCSGEVQIKRRFTVVFTNVYNASLDADKRQLLEQSLMSDQQKVILAVECDPTLNGNCITAAYDTDEGLEYIVDEKYNKQFIGIVSNFEIQYIERKV